MYLDYEVLTGHGGGRNGQRRFGSWVSCPWHCAQPTAAVLSTLVKLEQN